ncbi:hypothetical protein VNI00_016255 [Paramarasmius palmivorus]|uniref:Uncharacterized protein n=1 Tax=Paramarasmius palmivorus TaxID=297713 RepID=A0AAW0BDT9_9AGAR
MKLSLFLSLFAFVGSLAQNLPPPAIPAYDPAFPRICSEPMLSQKLSVQSFPLRDPSPGSYEELKGTMSLMKFNGEGNLTHAFVGRYDSDPNHVTQLVLWDEIFWIYLNRTFTPFSAWSSPDLPIDYGVNQTSVLITNKRSLWYALHAPVTQVLVGIGREDTDYKGLTDQWVNTLSAGATGHWGTAWGASLVGFDVEPTGRRVVVVSGWQSTEAYDSYVAALQGDTKTLYDQWQGSLVNPQPEWTNLTQTP